MALSPDAPEKDPVTKAAAGGSDARGEISRRIVALLKDGIGRGPSSARTFIHEDLVLVVFHDTLTRGEKVLAEDERVGLVREMRRAFLKTLRDDIAAVVAEETGRKVRGVLNDHAVDPDYAIGAFLLDGDPEDHADEQPRPASGSDAQGNDTRRAVSRGMSAIYKDFIGRGPTYVRTYMDEDVIAVLLTDTMTRVEQSLASDDRGDSVREIRREFQNSIKKDAIELIEGATGHKLVAFMSDHSVDADIAVEVFVIDGPLEEHANDETLEQRAREVRAPALDGEPG